MCAEVNTDAPATADGIWSWGWHDDGGQNNFPQPRDLFTPLVTPEVRHVLHVHNESLGHHSHPNYLEVCGIGVAMGPFLYLVSTPLENEVACCCNTQLPVLLRALSYHFISSCLQLCKRVGRGGLRDSSQMRSQGGRSRSSTPHDDLLDTSLPRRCRRFPNSKKESQGSGSGGGRRWTADEFDNDPSRNKESTSTPRALSAESPSLTLTLMGPPSDPTKDSIYICVGDDASRSDDTIAGDNEELAVDGSCKAGELLPQDSTFTYVGGEASRSDDMIVGEMKEPSIDGNCKADELVRPPVPQQQMTRRVSFADDGHGTSSSLGNGGIHETNESRMRLSSLVDCNIKLGPRARRRSSNFERDQYAMELVRAAHELMFTDTRPDGLRPITGTPMMDGQGLGACRGVYVGLAGLKGFDVSFVGAAANNHDGAGSMRGSSPRPPGRASSSPDASNVSIGGIDPGLRSTTSASNPDVTWLEQGSLLDRAPGSLIPPERGSDDSPIGNRRGCTGSSQAAGEQGHSRSDVPTAGPSRPAGLPGKTENMEGSTQIIGGYSGETEVSRRETNFGELTGMVETETSGGDGLGASMAQKAMAFLFTSKAAVLWSAANVGVDDLVLSAATKLGDEVQRNGCSFYGPGLGTGCGEFGVYNMPGYTKTGSKLVLDKRT